MVMDCGGKIEIRLVRVLSHRSFLLISPPIFFQGENDTMHLNRAIPNDKNPWKNLRKL